MPANDDRACPEALDALGRFWDAVVLEREAPAAADPTPALTATIRELHALDDAPGADPAFGRRLLTDLMGLAVVAPAPPPLPVIAAPPPARVTPSPTAAAPPAQRTPRRWLPAFELAAVAALLLALVGGLAGGYGYLPGVGGSQGAVGSPVIDSGQVQRSILTLPLEVKPGASPFAFVLRRLVLVPGANWKIASTAVQPGALVMDHYAEHGSLTLQVRSPLPRTSTDVTLGQGRNFGVGGIPEAIRNDGNEPVTVLEAVAYAANAAPPYPPPSAGINVQESGGGRLDGLPAGTGVISVQSAEAAPGDRLPTPISGLPIVVTDEGGSAAFDVTRGAVQVRRADANGRLPTPSGGWIGVELPHAGADVTLARGNTAFIPIGSTIGDVRNTGGDPLIALVATVGWVSNHQPGTPAAVASPPDAVLDGQPPLSGRFDVLAANP